MTPEQYADLVRQLLDDLAAVPRRITEAYRDGVTEGIELGKRIGAEQAERDMAAHWAALSRKIRAEAIGWTPYLERRAAELERAKPRPGDYTGRLSAEEYFGTADPPAALERHAA